MPSLSRGESSSAANPVLDLYTALGNPPTSVDSAVVEYRIMDISTPTKKGAPVQVYPAGIGTWATLNVVDAPPDGQRLGVGHYYAPWDVPLDEPIGDHRIEWQFKRTVLAPYEAHQEELYVFGPTLIGSDTYCSVADIRSEGFTDAILFPDSRILYLCELATRYIDKVCGRWFAARIFGEDNPLRLDGPGGYNAGLSSASGSRTLHLEIPVIRLDKCEVELQGLFNPSRTEISLELLRVYNRHLSGMTQPDDRENPRIAYIQSRIVETIASGLYPSPSVFPQGRQNVWLQGVFGYTDPDGSEFGRTPALIQQAACRLVIRDLYTDSEACKKLNVKNKFRIVSDKEGSTTIRLQDLWLKGAFTGDPEIDNVLMMYKRPPRIGVA